jgi:uncharacterized protein YjdB
MTFSTRKIVWQTFRLAVLPAALFCFAAGLGAQEKDNPPKKPESKVATVEVTPAEAVAEVGDTVQFTALGKDASGNAQPDKPTVWFAAPFDTGGADMSGKVKVFGAGEVTVGAVIGGKVGYAKIHIKRPHIARIEVAPLSAPVVAGGTAQALATPRNANGEPRSDIAITWTSENAAVARVDAAGLVTAVSPGRAKIRAAGDGVSGEASVTVVRNPAAHISVSPASAQARTGDVVHFAIRAQDAQGANITAPAAHWAVTGAGAQVWQDGAFVAERPGTYAVSASVGDRTAVASVVVAPRNVAREVEVVAHAMLKDEQFAEEWIWGNYAYLSTIDDKVFVYDISDPSKPNLTDTVKVDARLVNDVSVTSDGKTGVITREGASNRKNGIVFLDTSDPLHPKQISEYTATVTGGVHSAFVNSHYVYLTDDATGSLRVIDFADVKNPKEVARWQTESPLAMQVEGPMGPVTIGRFLHDDQVLEGLAYLAYWRDGLVILDVGRGIKGGSPEKPQLVSQLRFNYDELYGPGWLAGAHAVYRYKNYVFIGDEVFPGQFDITSKSRIPVRGIVHVVDVSDIAHPREVATYSVPESGAHNIWVFDDILYMGYYNGGGRVLDVSGELRGELYNQGREIAKLWTGDPAGYRPNLPFAWGAYPYKGLIYVNDVHSGLWIARLGKLKQPTLTTEMPH